jgi:uncharacterized protein YuzE
MNLEQYRRIKTRKQAMAVLLSEKQASNISSAIREMHDVVFRYDGDADALSVYFTRATPGLIETSDGPCDDVEEDITFDLDINDKIVSIEFLDASDYFSCHFYDSVITIDGKAPLSLAPVYNPHSDAKTCMCCDNGVVRFKCSTNTVVELLSVFYLAELLWKGQPKKVTAL